MSDVAQTAWTGAGSRTRGDRFVTVPAGDSYKSIRQGKGCSSQRGSLYGGVSSRCRHLSCHLQRS